MSPGVMVLAAGRGTRLASVSAELPKPLARVGGRSLLQWTLEWLASSGLGEVWINLHHQGARIREALGDGARYGLSLRYSEEEQLLGTAGGWRRVVERAGGKPRCWLVLYGDNLMRFSLSGLLAAHGRGAAAATGGGALATVALFDPSLHANTGIAGGWAVAGADGRIGRFVEGAGAVEGGYVNAGAYVLEPEVVEMVPQGPADFGRDVLPRLAAVGDLGGHVLERSGFCLGVDTPERLARAERMLQSAEVRP